MRGGQGGASPWTSPLDGRLGNTACSLECLACLNHVHGWTIWGGYGTLPLKPRFLVASDRSQVARRRVRLDLGDLGSLNSNSTRARTSLVPKPLPVVMHSPVTGLFRVLLDRFLLPTIRPRFRATYDWAYPISSPFSIAMYGVTDSCAKTLGKYCSCTSASVGRASSPPTTRRYEIDLATHRASQGHAQS